MKVETDKPLRVLEVVDTLDAGGMEAQLVALLNRLDPAQFEFEVVCLRHAGVYAPKLRSGVCVRALEKQAGFQWKTARQLGQIARRGGFDVIHTHNWAPLIYSVLGTSGGRTHRILHGEHSQLNHAETTRKRLWLRRLLYKCCAGVHTVSAGQKEELLRLGLAPPHLWSLVNGVDTQRFQPLSVPSHRAALRERMIPGSTQDFWLGMVARFGAYKRHRELIKAFEAVAPGNPHSRLILVGDGGPEKNAVMRQIEASPLRDRIHCMGYQADPVPYYQAMDLLVVPSANEGLSNATLEAMACGVPVLSNTICGARELIGEDEAGWVADLASQETLQTALHSTLSLSVMELQKHGESGRLRAVTQFSWDGMARRYEDTFRACASEPD